MLTKQIDIFTSNECKRFIKFYKDNFEKFEKTLFNAETILKYKENVEYLKALTDKDVDDQMVRLKITKFIKELNSYGKWRLILQENVYEIKKDKRDKKKQTIVTYRDKFEITYS